MRTFNATYRTLVNAEGAIAAYSTYHNGIAEARPNGRPIHEQLNTVQNNETDCAFIRVSKSKLDVSTTL
jgi:hypothetical protein